MDLAINLSGQSSDAKSLRFQLEKSGYQSLDLSGRNPVPNHRGYGITNGGGELLGLRPEQGRPGFGVVFKSTDVLLKFDHH